MHLPALPDPCYFLPIPLLMVRFSANYRILLLKTCLKG
ncbi:hypothetical protein D088_840078 [Salmonella enterica subsp. houtenae serovar 16:z4,z32:-- str. RKS3027]|nr:hypothetical protein D088_840078 [Salmonella enterica subsp. houtenae serovar 16:z4,z32:-- str. RKS3027]